MVEPPRRLEVGNEQAKIFVPTRQEITAVLAAHPLIRLTGKVKRAYLVGSFAKGSPHVDSDVDVLLEVSPRARQTEEELTEKYRSKLRQYFVTHNIRGKADHLHPQWCDRRVDVYFTYETPRDERPRIRLPD